MGRSACGMQRTEGMLEDVSNLPVEIDRRAWQIRSPRLERRTTFDRRIYVATIASSSSNSHSTSESAQDRRKIIRCFSLAGFGQLALQLLSLNLLTMRVRTGVLIAEQQGSVPSCSVSREQIHRLDTESPTSDVSTGSPSTDHHRLGWPVLSQSSQRLRRHRVMRKFFYTHVFPSRHDLRKDEASLLESIIVDSASDFH